MKHRFSQEATQLVGSPMFKMLAQVQELERAGKSIIHFEIGDPDFSTPPHIGEAAINAIRGGDTHYANSLGIAEFRDVICDATERDLGWRPKREQVVVAPSISFIYFLVRALMNPGEEVVVPDPGYSSYFSAFDFVGVRPVSVPLFEKNNFRMRAQDFENSVTEKTRLAILNSPHNPTGAMMDADDLAKIFAIAQNRNFYVISDEVYSKMTYEKKHESISINDRCEERTIILNGFSKAYAMTGWRLGYVIAPVEIVEKLGLMIQTVISNVPPFIQRAGIAALKGDQSCVKDMMTEYAKRRAITVDGLNQLPGVTSNLPDGAFYAFANISKTGMTSTQFSEFVLEEAGVALLPGTDFGAHGEGYVRLTFANGTENIHNGISRLQKALKERQL